MELSERDTKILQAIIDDYIATGEPVGSRTLSKKYPIHLSPATIRNVMADLEELGLLKQPHASSGRIPTDQAYRFYVDSILEINELDQAERALIEKGYDFDEVEIPKIMEETSRILSLVTNYTAVVVAPRFMDTVFKQIQFIKLREDRILVIFISSSGMVQNKVIQVEEDLSQADLDKYSNYLNDLMKELTLSEAKQKIIEQMEKEKVIFDKLFYRALEICKKALNGPLEGDVYIQGKENIFDHPEFVDIEKMKALMQALEEKHILLKLLDRSTAAGGIQIFIGAENELLEVQNCTLVTSSFGNKSKLLGTMGVIGPTRMNYSKVIPVVDYTAKVVSKILESR